MASKLFLLEFQFGNIEFVPTFKPVPKKDEILINIKFFNVSLDIDPAELQVHVSSGILTPTEKIPFNMGKSYLFTLTPREILDKMNAGNIEISLRIHNKTEGSIILPWKRQFLDMVKLFETLGVKGASHSETSHMTNKNNEVIVTMDVLIRMACYGDLIESQYLIKTTGTAKEYYFKNPYEKTILKCDALEGNHVFPMIKIIDVESKADPGNEIITLSWTELFGTGELPSKESYPPYTGTEGQGVIPLHEILQHNSLETVSIIYRPDENKFFDLLNMYSTEVTLGQDMTKLTFTKDETYRNSLETRKAAVDDPLELTADKINRMLCKNKDCPAAKKFKEYGIGPLATGKGLGTIYGDVESTVEYGLSNTYGSMSKYGPFGIYTKPKSPEQPYIPPKDVPETRPPPKQEKKRYCSCCNRLRGGGPWPDQPFVLIENSPDNKISAESTASPEILRLRGGGPEPSNSAETLQKDLLIEKSINCLTWAELLRLRGGGPLEPDEVPLGLKSPIKECKPVMDKFDEILAAYKRVLGPCGQATCSNSPALLEERCREVCKEGKSPPQDDMGSGRDATKEGWKRIMCEDPCDPTKNVPSAACGNPKCAYVKYKLDLVDDDAALELEYLPPAVSGKCGHPKCQYPIEPNLPPIHWDCPDPLPKGKCKNLNCPYQPRQLRRFKTKEPKPGPCGSTDCPYALPPPCDVPTCPFKPKPCPYLEQQEEEEICENPECPFANEQMNPSESFDENLAVKGQFVSCANPACPFVTQGTRRPKPKCEKPNVCDIPACPFSKVKKVTICDNPTCPSAPKQPCPFTASLKKGNDICNNPRCPFAPPPPQEDDDVCDNPQCPFAIKPKKNNNLCSNPRPQEDDDVCDNPQCPFAIKPKKNPCSNPRPQEDDDICDNPQCPFAIKPKKNLCSNPRCPNAPKPVKKESICSNPDCPSAAKKQKRKGNGCGDPACPSTPQPKEDDGFICGDPQCPFAEGKQNRIDKDDISECFRPDNNGDNCDNPECPYNKENDSDDSAECKSKESVCDNPDCPYAKKDSSDEEEEICDDPMCPYNRPLPSCGIPGCPFEPVPMMPCPGPRKAKKGKKSRVPCRKSPVRCREGSIVKEPALPGEQIIVEQEVEVVETSKKRKKKKRSKFVYSMGNQYTGVQVGHRECVTPLFNVPPKMGWLWNVPLIMAKDYKPRRGWKPGAIQRSIAARIKAHREAKGLGILKVPKFSRGKENADDAEYEIPVSPKPTLQIQKKDGAYWITMNPLKDPNTLVYRENPYMDCTPMQFKITKNKKKKEYLDDENRLCYCDEDEETESSSDSELDIEFTPPAGIIHPERFKKKKNIVHCEVQYDPKDFASEAKGKDKKGKKGKDKGGKGKKGKKGKK